MEWISVSRAAWHNLFQVSALAAAGGWVVAAILGGVVWSLAHRHPEVKYFPVSPAGVLLKAVPLDRPLLSDSAILTGAETAVISSFNMNWKDWRMRMQNAQRWFTPQGFTAYQDIMTNSGDLEAVRQRRLVLSVAVIGSPVVKQSGILSGTHLYAWKVQIPVRLAFESSDVNNSKARLLTIVVVRANILSQPRGWAIASMVFGPMSYHE